jgi:hypothetical protein
MEVIGLSETLEAVQQALNEKRKQAEVATRLAGNEYKNDVQKLAPYKTGTYRRSIHVGKVQTEANGSPFVLVGTDLPYGKRLEFGFWDMTDRLGRHYYQRARPHFRPALDLNLQKYYRIMKGTFDRNSTEMLVEGSY